MKHALSASFLVVVCAVPAWAQKTDSPADIKTLYATAAYEEALGEIGRTEPMTPRLELYRAFCLLALGRTDDARSAVTRAVNGDPFLVPGEADASPRVRAFFDGVRTELLPQVIREKYNEGKAAYVAKDRERAYATFEKTLELLASLGEPARAGLADLELVAREFRDLSAPPKPPVTPAPAPGPTSPATPAQPQAPPVMTVAAAAIDQVFPAWRWSRLPENLRGTVRLQIDETGQVLNAEIVTATDPQYDREVLAAARKWRYKPASRNGRPLPSELEVTYVLKAPK